MKQIEITDKEYMLLCATLIRKINKMKSNLAKYGLDKMRENVEEYERLLTHLEENA